MPAREKLGVSASGHLEHDIVVVESLQQPIPLLYSFELVGLPFCQPIRVLRDFGTWVALHRIRLKHRSSLAVGQERVVQIIPSVYDDPLVRTAPAPAKSTSCAVYALGPRARTRENGHTTQPEEPWEHDALVP